MLEEEKKEIHEKNIEKSLGIRYINSRLKGLISMNMDKNIQEIPMEDIIPNRFQPRLAFNEEGINELAESIKQHGIIQPLVVRRLGDKFEIIAGERRYKAATMAGLTKVPVIISDIDDNKSAEVALVENIQRRNLTAIEEAKSYKNLLDRGYLTQEQLANKMGVSQSSIANKLRLLNLDEEVQDALLNEKISERHARALLTLDNKEDQKKWLQKIIAERMTVRQLDMELKKLQENGGEEDEGIPLVDINPNIEEIVNNAEDINVVREPHDVASMLLPEGAVKEEAKPVEQKDPTPTKMPNKFFNFLEDEQANMSVIEPDEILNTFKGTIPGMEIPEPTMEPQPEETVEHTSVEQPEENVASPIMPSVEVLDDLDSMESAPVEQPKVEEPFNPFGPTPTLEAIETPVITETNKEVENIEASPIEELPSIMPTLEPITEEQSIDIPGEPQMESTPLENNNIEQPTLVEEPVIEITSEPIAEPAVSAIENQEIQPTSDQPSVTPIMNTTENTETNANDILINEPTVEPVINNEEITPFKSIFFNTGEESEPTVEEVPIVNNTIEEVKPVIEEPLVDPLDSIVKLEPDYEEKQKELAGKDLKTAINVVRDTVADLENRGFLVEIEEADLEDLYHITIKINKNDL